MRARKCESFHERSFTKEAKLEKQRQAFNKIHEDVNRNELEHKSNSFGFGMALKDNEVLEEVVDIADSDEEPSVIDEAIEGEQQEMDNFDPVDTTKENWQNDETKPEMNTGMEELLTELDSVEDTHQNFSNGKGWSGFYSIQKLQKRRTSGYSRNRVSYNFDERKG